MGVERDFLSLVILPVHTQVTGLATIDPGNPHEGDVQEHVVQDGLANLQGRRHEINNRQVQNGVDQAVVEALQSLLQPVPFPGQLVPFRLDLLPVAGKHRDLLIGLLLLGFQGFDLIFILIQEVLKDL